MGNVDIQAQLDGMKLIVKGWERRKQITPEQSISICAALDLAIAPDPVVAPATTPAGAANAS